MYFVKYGKEYLHDPRIDEFRLTDISLTSEENSYGYCDFVIYPDHPMYDKIKERDSENQIEVYDDDQLLFAGYIYEFGREFYLDNHVRCKGELDYLNTSVVRPSSTYSRDFGETIPCFIDQYFEWLIKQHNSQVDESRRFVVGINDGPKFDPNNYIEVSLDDYPTTMTAIKTTLLENFGGYLRVRHDGSIRYIDYLYSHDDVNSQLFDFGVNLTDYVQTDNSEEMATYIIPSGAKMMDTDYEYDDGYFQTSDTEVYEEKIYYTMSYEFSDRQNLTSFTPGVTYYEGVKDSIGARNLALKWACETSEDDVGYSQEASKRWGPRYYDCSSFVITAWQNAGVPVKDIGASWTGNMLKAFKAMGFVETSKNNLKPGDVLWNTEHTAMYVGTYTNPNGIVITNRLVEAFRGDVAWNDQVRVAKYYDMPWTKVLRYSGSISKDISSYSITTDETPNPDKVYFVRLKKYVQCEDLTTFKSGVTYYEYSAAKDKSNIPLTISDLSDGNIYSSKYFKVLDYIYSIPGTEKFGKIGYSYSNSQLKTKEELALYAVLQLDSIVSPKRTIEIKAVDMHLINPDMKPIRIGEYVRVRSKPHGLDSYFLCRSIDLDLTDPENSIYTLGISYDTMTGLQDKKINELNSHINSTYESATEISEEAKAMAITASDSSALALSTAEIASEKVDVINEAYESGELNAVTVSISSSNGIIFKRTSENTVLTAHVYKGGSEQEIDSDGTVGDLGTIKWYKDDTFIIAANSLVVLASELTNGSGTYYCQLEG